MTLLLWIAIFFFFNDTATTEIYTLSLHDALPICAARSPDIQQYLAILNEVGERLNGRIDCHLDLQRDRRSEEHTSELQSHSDLVCRLLLEKKKKKYRTHYRIIQQQDDPSTNHTAA